VKEDAGGEQSPPLQTLNLMRPETRKSMEMLFNAKWNLPKAAEHARLTNKECKIVFNEYCNFHPPIYGVDNQENT
jgi:hypothetical protein